MKHFLKKSLELMFVTIIVGGLAILTGCVCPTPAAQQPAAAEPVVMAAPPVGNVMVEQAFPNCTAEKSAVLVKKTAPAEVVAGQEFDYQLTVINLTECTLTDVTVMEHFADGFTYASSDPAAQVQGESAAWMLGSMAPNESKVITVTGVAAAEGEIVNCTEVTYNTELCMSIAVVQPALKLEKMAPAESLLCDAIPVTFKVTNTGTGIARNVEITDTLPDGLKTADGGNTISIQAGDLTAGQSYETQVILTAAKTGTFENTASAASANGLTAEASTTTVVKQPVLEITKTARETQFAGRPIAYEITISNVGDASADELRVVDILPAQTAFVSASHGGMLQADGTVAWDLASLAPGASRTLTLNVNTVAVGNAVNEVRAKDACSTPVKATVTTAIEGVPAVLLEVIDLTDPVEIGEQTVYEITATNQGFAQATNVTIVCELEDNQDYVSDSGATDGTLTGQVVKFAPLAVLAPKEKAVWQVVVKATAAGDTRFTVRMTADQLTRPVMETEATNQY
jgi:uncharacterized repeat protein (TIGR01451 family)